MPEKIRWGIMGTGAIAHKFAEGLKAAEAGELGGVGSRKKQTAEKFGDEFAVPIRYGSYADLAADDRLDAIYIATPHPQHRDNSIMCIEAGRAVLCEKPFTVNAAQAAEVIRAARKGKVFCMEAMWTLFLPSFVKLRELLAERSIGDVRMVFADFGFRGGWNPQGRLLNPQYAGGSLLDIGIYTLALALMVLGKPSRITSQAHIGETCVDEQAGIVLGYDGGALAVLGCAIRAQTQQEAWIVGTEGSIHLQAPWWKTQKMTLTFGSKPRTIKAPMVGNGYNYEADHLARCLAAGRLESDIMPLTESLSLMETMDEIRSQWNLKYPME